MRCGSTLISVPSSLELNCFVCKTCANRYTLYAARERAPRAPSGPSRERGTGGGERRGELGASFIRAPAHQAARRAKPGRVAPYI